MNILKNKKLAIATAIILVLSMSASMTLMLPTEAAARGWTWVSYAYIVVAPNPVGVDQTVTVVMWVDGALPGATVTNDIRRHDYTLTITDPDGNEEKQTWDVVSDSTGMVAYQYVPTKVGNYTFHFEYPDQNYTWAPAAPNNVYQYDLFLGAEKSQTLVVQQEPIPASKDSYPLPTEFWSRPIEGQNTYWYSVASNWLGTPYVIGAGAGYGIPGAVQLDGSAPNSAHVMWTKGIQYGGVVGGNDTAVPGEMWYSGLSYNTRFSNPIIMQGTLFYPEPFGNGGSGGYYIAVDLQTGQELWRVNTTATGINLVPSFGYIYSYESPNQHGALPNGLLIASYTVGTGSNRITCWAGYDPRSGVLTTMNVTNIPSGIAAAGPQGEYLIYVLTNYGNTSNPNWYLAQWNSSKVFGGGSGLSPANWYSGTANAGVASAYDWNISIPSLKGDLWTVGKGSLGAIPLVNPGDKLLLVQGGFGAHPGDFGVTVSADPGNITAINLKAGSVGQVIWAKTYPPAPGNNSRIISEWDPANNIFIFVDKEDMVHYGYSLTTGEKVWGPTDLTDDYTTDYNFMAIGLERAAYGKLYYAGYAGILYCYDIADNGNLLWTYGNGGEGNSTSSGFETPYGRYPIFISTIADNKVYLTTTEHSPNSPLYKDAQLRCVNATSGEELWTIMDYGNQMYGGQVPIADGYLTTLNSYDSQIYCYGKGASALTVSAPDVAAPLGTPIVIRGTAIDIAAGTQQKEQAARFPHGVPAVSDESMSSWMEYVYMQKPRPTDVTGIPIQLYVLDANNNYREIGETTSDANGAFSFTWTPDIEGSYVVIASFAGSESFYPSQAESSFAVSAAAPTQEPYPQVSVPSNEMYFVGSTVAIIIAIALATVLILRKK